MNEDTTKKDANSKMLAETIIQQLKENEKQEKKTLQKQKEKDETFVSTLLAIWAIVFILAIILWGFYI